MASQSFSVGAIGSEIEVTVYAEYNNYPLRYGVSPYNKDDWDYIEKIKFKPIVKCLYM